jgi:addiction module HigA family antidote
MSKIVNGRAAITTDIALRLASAFESSAEFWLNLQHQYDIYVLSKKAA